MKKHILKQSSTRPWPSGRTSILLLAMILLAASALRLGLARSPGYEFDVSVNQKWAKSAVELGLSQSYAEQVDGNMLPNYPPLSLIVFASAGRLYRGLIDAKFDIAAPLFDLWIKLPAMLFDLLTVIAVWCLLRKKSERLALLGTALYAFHPVVWYDSAVWGQTDALYTLPVLLGMIAYARERMMLAGALLAIAVLMKFQAIAVFPLLLLSIMKPRRVLALASGGIIVIALVALPFLHDNGIAAIANVYRGSVGYYPTLTVGAYNFWWSVLGDRSWAMQDSEIFLWGVRYRLAGFILFTFMAAWIVTAPRLLKAGKKSVEDVLLGAALLSLAFFLFNAQMHERYFFPFCALALPAALRSRAVMIPYLVISLLGWMNLLGALPWGSFDRAIFARFDTIDVACATTMVVTFMLMTARFNAQRPKG